MSQSQSQLYQKNPFLFQIEMNTTLMLTYYYDDPTELPDNLTVTTSANAVTHAVANMTNTVASVTNSVAKVANMSHVRQEQGGPLTRLDHSANPALVHHLYLGLGHMGKVSSGHGHWPDM